MITIEPELAALFASGAFAEVGLVQVDFSSGTQRLAMWPVDIVSGGFTWRGIGDVIKIPAAKSAAEINGESLSLELSLANLAILATLSGPSSEWRGRRVTFLTQFMTAAFVSVGAPKRFWCGTMRNISTRVESSDGISTAVIAIDIAPLGMGRARTAEGLRWTAAQHRQRYPDDAGLDGLESMLQKTSWLSKAYQDSLNG